MYHLVYGAWEYFPEHREVLEKYDIPKVALLCEFESQR